MNLPGEGVRGTALWSLPQADEGKGEACPRQKRKKNGLLKNRQSYCLSVQILAKSCGKYGNSSQMCNKMA
jgi:hypothetical protein